jgi:hypothetical protein
MIMVAVSTLTFTVFTLAILLYLVYRESEVDLPPRNSTHDRTARHD